MKEDDDNYYANLDLPFIRPRYTIVNWTEEILDDIIEEENSFY